MTWMRQRFPHRRWRDVCRGFLPVAIFAAVAGSGCGDDDAGIIGDEQTAIPANQQVRNRIASRAPAASLGHRGTGPTRAGHPFPENALVSFRQAVAEGADGVELDVELTSDLKLIIMHDDTLDRTTTCTGCVNAMTFAAARQCRLLSGEGEPTAEAPPTLEEVYAALPPDVLVNVELKVFGARCLTPETGAEALARAAVDEVRRLGGAHRTLFSSFGDTAAAAVKAADAALYAALLVTGLKSRDVDLAVQLGLDAIHPGGPFPFVQISPDLMHNALTRGLQVNVWTVDTAEAMHQVIDTGATAIITDEPAVLAAVLAARR